MGYTLEQGSYYLRSGSTIRLMTDQVTIAFSHKPPPEGVGWTLHKHGRLESVQAWWQEYQQAAGPLFGEILLITFPLHFDVDRINAIIEHPSKLAELLEEADEVATLLGDD